MAPVLMRVAGAQALSPGPETPLVEIGNEALLEGLGSRIRLLGWIEAGVKAGCFRRVAWAPTGPEVPQGAETVNVRSCSVFRAREKTSFLAVA